MSCRGGGLLPCGRVVPPREYTGVAMLMNDSKRAVKLISNAVRGLDFTGLTVLTEAATREYAVTPIIAAVAGARVYALATTTEEWGHAKDAEMTVRKFANMCGVQERVEVITDKRRMAVEQADIVTNLGGLRPLDEGLIKMMKPGAIILCMHEKWELREDDIELSACKSKVPVVCIEEMDLFKYCGVLCAKLLFEAGVEIYHNKIVIIGEGNFVGEAATCLSAMGAKVVTPGLNWLAETKDCDAVVVADLHSVVVTGDGIDVPIIRLAEGGRMPKTLAHLGVKPVIELHTLGFKTAMDFLAGKKKRHKSDKRDLEK